jgi:hypothetical protein
MINRGVATFPSLYRFEGIFQGRRGKPTTNAPRDEQIFVIIIYRQQILGLSRDRSFVELKLAPETRLSSDPVTN